MANHLTPDQTKELCKHEAWNVFASKRGLQEGDAVVKDGDWSVVDVRKDSICQLAPSLEDLLAFARTLGWVHAEFWPTHYLGGPEQIVCWLDSSKMYQIQEEGKTDLEAMYACVLRILREAA